MTDIVEQAARVTDGLLYGPEALVRPKGRDIAQALADAGLLADPARTVPTREELAEVLTYALTGAGIDDYREYSGEEGLRAYYRMADAALALMHNQPTVAEAKAQALEDLAREATDNTELDKTDRHLISNWCTVAAQQIRDEPPSPPTLKTRPQPTELRIEWKRGTLPPRPETTPVQVRATCRHCDTVTISEITAPGRIPQPLLKCDCQQYRDGK